MYRYISQGVSSMNDLRAVLRQSAAEFLDLRITAIGPDFLIGDLPVDDRTRQPYGLLHGGMSMVLAETLGSAASALLVSDEADTRVLGIEVGGSHLRSVRSGRVTGVCRPMKLGRSAHFWRVDIAGEDGKLCCAAHVTMLVVRRDAASGA